MLYVRDERVTGKVVLACDFTQVFDDLFVGRGNGQVECLVVGIFGVVCVIVGLVVGVASFLEVHVAECLYV